LSLIRQRLASAGSDQRELDVLRHTLASSEDLRVLRALAVALEEFRDYAGDGMLGDVGDFRDRLSEKMLRLLGATSPAPRRPKSKCAAANIGTAVSPPADEETGHLSCLVAADGTDPLLAKLRAVHGEAARSDITPELLAVLAGRKEREARRP
jgi:hypothetical protein